LRSLAFTCCKERNSSRRADHRLQRRNHGAVCLCDHAAERRRGRAHQLEPDGRFAGVPLGVVFLLEVAYWVARATSHMAQASLQAVSTRDLSTLLFREYVFPFELTSFLILIALLGALVLARREDSD